MTITTKMGEDSSVGGSISQTKTNEFGPSGEYNLNRRTTKGWGRGGGSSSRSTSARTAGAKAGGAGAIILFLVANTTSKTSCCHAYRIGGCNIPTIASSGSKHMKVVLLLGYVLW